MRGAVRGRECYWGRNTGHHGFSKAEALDAAWEAATEAAREAATEAAREAATDAAREAATKVEREAPRRRQGRRRTQKQSPGSYWY